MHTVGNDIVDLGNLGPPLHRRYHDRILARVERRTIESSDQDLWKYWAAKEAAYKALRRRQPTLPFLPRELVFDPVGSTITYKDIELACIVTTSSELVHVVCTPHTKTCSDPPPFFATAIADTSGSNRPASASECVRRLARQLASAVLRLPVERLATSPPHGRSSLRGVPVLSVDGCPSSHVISLSHDGRFVACALRVAPGTVL